MVIIMRIKSAYEHNPLALLVFTLLVGNAEASTVFLPDLFQGGIVSINNGVATMQTGNNNPSAVDTGIFTDPVNGNTLGLRGSTLTDYSTLPAGTIISFNYEFTTTDPPVFNDFAIISFDGVDTELIADSYTVPPSGDSGIKVFSYVLPANYGSFTIVDSNSIATANNAILQIQNLNIQQPAVTPVPVPPQWPMFILSCAILVSWARKNRIIDRKGSVSVMPYFGV
jgi:hypothetical protein